MSEKKEFETLLASLGERELSENELARMWQLIEKKEERLDEYLATQQMNFALEDMNFSLVSDEKTSGKAVPQNTKRNYSALIALAATGVIAFSLFWLLIKPAPSDSAKVVSPINPQEHNKDSSQKEYEKKIGEIPTTGSLNRPPTDFTSVQPEDKIDFNRDIQPLIAENCISCHGPDAKHREADLRLDTYEGLLSENTVVPGKPEKSELITRIYTNDEV